MNWKLLTGVVLCCGFLAGFIPDLSAARGGGGGGRGGGGGFGGGERGGGGFSRGGDNMGSVRNSSGLAQRNRPSQLPSRPEQSLGQNRPSQLPAKPVERPGYEYRPGQGQLPGQSNRPGNSVLPGQGGRLDEIAGSPGLKPSQLPADRNQFADRDWNNWQGERRDDWDDWYNDHYHGHWDDNWHTIWWTGYPVAAVSYGTYLMSAAPCNNKVLVQGVNTYYYCGSGWYQPVYASGQVQYISASAPAGVEFNQLSTPYTVSVGGKDYFVSNHTFYEQLTLNGQTVYRTVAAPIGAVVRTIPDYAVQVEKGGQVYYRYDQVFYQTQGDGFIVVLNPGF